MKQASRARQTARWVIHYVEALTDAAERQMRAIIDEIMQVGVSRAIESGLVQRRLMLRSALQEEQRIASGEKVIVGVNKFQRTQGPPRLRCTVPTQDTLHARWRLQRVKAERDPRQVERFAAFDRRGSWAENVMPAMLEPSKPMPPLAKCAT